MLCSIHGRPGSVKERGLRTTCRATKGWSVWWAPKVDAGRQFDDQIEAELKAARAVVVVWTPTSVTSR